MPPRTPAIPGNCSRITASRARYLSLHEHNERERAAAIVARLDAGDDVALVSDAGTPLIADPGRASSSRQCGRRGIAVVPIPGPSALLAAVVASGLVPGPFTFVGFLPPKRGARRAALESIRALPHPDRALRGAAPARGDAGRCARSSSATGRARSAAN